MNKAIAAKKWGYVSTESTGASHSTTSLTAPRRIDFVSVENTPHSILDGESCGHSWAALGQILPGFRGCEEESSRAVATKHICCGNTRTTTELQRNLNHQLRSHAPVVNVQPGNRSTILVSPYSMVDLGKQRATPASRLYVPTLADESQGWIGRRQHYTTTLALPPRLWRMQISEASFDNTKVIERALGQTPLHYHQSYDIPRALPGPPHQIDHDSTQILTSLLIRLFSSGSLQQTIRRSVRLPSITEAVRCSIPRSAIPQDSEAISQIAGAALLMNLAGGKEHKTAEPVPERLTIEQGPQTLANVNLTSITSPVATDEPPLRLSTKDVKVIDFPKGGQLRVFPGLLDESQLELIRHEMQEKVRYRQYRMQGVDEPRVHSLYHEDAIDPLKLAGVSHETVNDSQKECHPSPGYCYANTVKMKARPLSELPQIQKLSDSLKGVSGVSKWGVGVNTLVYRDGNDKIGKHADDDQGEEKIFTVIVDSPPQPRLVVIEPKKPDDIDSKRYTLTLNAGDAYEMDQTMQQFYTHQVPHNKHQTGYTKFRRSVIVLRSGVVKMVNIDSGKPVQSLEPPPRELPYKFGPIEGIDYGKEFSRTELVLRGAHNAHQRGISGNIHVGCDSIVVSGRRPDGLGDDHFGFLLYAAERRIGGESLVRSAILHQRVRVFRLHSYRECVSVGTVPVGADLSNKYIYDGLYRVLAFSKPAKLGEQATYLFILVMDNWDGQGNLNPTPKAYKDKISVLTGMGQKEEIENFFTYAEEFVETADGPPGYRLRTEALRQLLPHLPAHHIPNNAVEKMSRAKRICREALESRQKVKATRATTQTISLWGISGVPSSSPGAKRYFGERNKSQKSKTNGRKRRKTEPRVTTNSLLRKRLMSETIPGPHDILCGKMKREANSISQKLVKPNLKKFRIAPDRLGFVQSLLDEVHKQGGAFLMATECGFVEMDENAAFDKLRKTFGDALYREGKLLKNMQQTSCPDPGVTPPSEKDSQHFDQMATAALPQAIPGMQDFICMPSSVGVCPELQPNDHYLAPMPSPAEPTPQLKSGTGLSNTMHSDARSSPELKPGNQGFTETNTAHTLQPKPAGQDLTQVSSDVSGPPHLDTEEYNLIDCAHGQAQTKQNQIAPAHDVNEDDESGVENTNFRTRPGPHDILCGKAHREPNAIAQKLVKPNLDKFRIAPDRLGFVQFLIDDVHKQGGAFLMATGSGFVEMDNKAAFDKLRKTFMDALYRHGQRQVLPDPQKRPKRQRDKTPNPTTTDAGRRAKQLRDKTPVPKKKPISKDRRTTDAMMKGVPLEVRKLFGQLGFAKWGNSIPLPAKSMDPSMTPSSVMGKWLDEISKWKRRGGGRKNPPIVVKWYGELNEGHLFSIVNPASFTPYKEAGPKIRQQGEKAEAKQRAGTDLSPDDEKRIRGMKALLTELSRRKA